MSGAAEGTLPLLRIVLGASGAVTLLVVALLLHALLRRRAAERDESLDRRRALTGVSVAAGAVTLLVAILIGTGLATERAIAIRPEADELAVEVVGHRWWWELRYPGGAPQELVVTAGELHVPVGRTIRLDGRSADVLHRFLAPELAAALELSPFRRTVTRFRADRAGRFRAACAELCGVEHSRMALEVVAESEEEFDAWLRNQRSAAREPTTAPERRGKLVFEVAGCAGCHAVLGTRARGANGPDLTHLASRALLSAGARPNRPGWLAAFVVDPQTLKPGAKMPPTLLEGPDLDALVAYLGSLE